MKLLLWNVLLALIWAAATGLFTVGNFAAGFALGFLVLAYARRNYDATPYFRKVPRVLAFAAFYVKELVVSNLRVAYDVVTPTHYMKPGVVAVPLEVNSDAGITLLANLLTLTPGSLSLDVSTDRRVLYVHFMYIDDGDLDALRRKIKNDYEQRVLRVLE